MSTTLVPVPALTQLSEDEEMFRQAVREFAEAEVTPLIRQMDETATFDRSLLPKFGELGFFGIDIPEEHGGAGGTFFMSILAVEELARVDASASVLVDVHNTLAVVAVKQFGSQELHAKYLPRLATGEIVLAGSAQALLDNPDVQNAYLGG